MRRGLASGGVIAALAAVLTVGGCIFGSSGTTSDPDAAASDAGGADTVDTRDDGPPTPREVKTTLQESTWRGLIGVGGDETDRPAAGYMAEFLFLRRGNLNFFVGPIEIAADWSLTGDGEMEPFGVTVESLTVKQCHLDNKLFCGLAKAWARDYFEDTGQFELALHPEDRRPDWIAGTAPPASQGDEPADIAVSRSSAGEFEAADLVGEWTGSFESDGAHDRRLEIFKNSRGTSANASLDGNEQYTGGVVVMSVGGHLYWGITDTSTEDEVPVSAGAIQMEEGAPSSLKYPERDGRVSTLTPGK